jgi:predicted esterase
MHKRREIKVQFAHGLESSPQGRKAVLLDRHFSACTPAMNTRDFTGCLELHARTLVAFRPHVVVGSSFGGAVVVELLRRGLWQGPTLLLAQAALRYDQSARLPEGVPVTLVHGARDQVVPLEDSRRLARTGTKELVRLIEINDEHQLNGLVESGKLLELVLELAGAEPVSRGA